MTPTRRLLDLNLGGKLDEFVAERRAAGASWTTISFDLLQATGERVSDESLRTWFADLPTEAAS